MLKVLVYGSEVSPDGFRAARRKWWRRFGLPGAAETIWILPRGIHHDEPEFSPLEPVFPVHYLIKWSSGDGARALLALHEEVFGRRLVMDGTRTLRDQLGGIRRAFERGDLVAWARRRQGYIEPARVVVDPNGHDSDNRTRTWIELALRDDSGAPVSLEPYRMTLPDGSSRHGQLDAAGFARLEELDPGICDIEFPRLDGREWARGAAPSPSGAPGDGSPIAHRVRQGECMSSIAALYRFRSWRTVYFDPVNAELRAKRTDPNVLGIGDEVMIDRATKREEAPTTQRHEFVVLSSSTRLRVAFEGMKPLHFRLRVGEVSVEKPLPEDGLIDEPIRPDARQGELTVWFTDDTKLDGVTWNLDIGGLVDVDDLRGVQSRLNNLGFGAGPDDGRDRPELGAAVAAFQARRGKMASGIVDDALRNDLRAEHDEG